MRITRQTDDRFTAEGLPHLTIAAAAALAGLSALAVASPASLPPVLTADPRLAMLLPALLALAALLIASVGIALGTGEVDFDAVSGSVTLKAGISARHTLPLDRFRGARLGQRPADARDRKRAPSSRPILLFEEDGQLVEHILRLPVFARGKAPQIVFALNLWQIRRGGALADELADIPMPPVSSDGRGLPWARAEAQL